LRAKKDIPPTFARNRDTAEDALEQIAVEYRPLQPIVDPEAAAWPDAPLLHAAVGSNTMPVSSASSPVTTSA
jgi:CO/xanthine dehydrogenase Mo-binding subunit